MSVNEKMTAIADTIRRFTGKSGKLGLDDMPGAINEAVAANGYEEGYRTGYDDGEQNGYINGYADGNDDGRIEGKQEEYDRFWDAFQQNGNRTNYTYAFCGSGWTNETFKPKYLPIRPTVQLCMFSYSAFDLDVFSSEMFDFSALPQSGVTQMFERSAITHLGTYDARKTGMRYMFYSTPNLSTVEKLIIGDSQTQSNFFDNAFTSATGLEEVRFEGTVTLNGLNFRWSTKLSKASIENIISCLSATTSGLTVTLSKTAVESAFGSTTAAEWTALVGTKPNWTISLV